MNEEKANELARVMQKGFPLVERPYAELGRTIIASEDDVLEQVHEWKQSGLLREVSAVMEGRVLGYDSALVCGRIPQKDLKRVADAISSHPTVTHNYERAHDFNLWFTIAAQNEVGLEAHLRSLEELTGAGPFYALRRTLTFKVGVVFDLITRRNSTEKKVLSGQDRVLKTTDETRRIVRSLQNDLPVAAEPFRLLAAEHGVDSGALLEFARSNPLGAMRKYVATFRHRKLGVRGNSMVVWKVPEAELAAAGDRLANAPEVSHCYARETFPDFPFNLYSMVHMPTEADLEATVSGLRRSTGDYDYIALKSLREFKKTRLRYFLPELDEWERRFSLRAA